MSYSTSPERVLKAFLLLALVVCLRFGEVVFFLVGACQRSVTLINQTNDIPLALIIHENAGVGV